MHNSLSPKKYSTDLDRFCDRDRLTVWNNTGYLLSRYYVSVGQLSTSASIVYLDIRCEMILTYNKFKTVIVGALETVIGCRVGRVGKQSQVQNLVIQ